MKRSNDGRRQVTEMFFSFGKNILWLQESQKTNWTPPRVGRWQKHRTTETAPNLHKNKLNTAKRQPPTKYTKSHNLDHTETTKNLTLPKSATGKEYQTNDTLPHPCKSKLKTAESRTQQTSRTTRTKSNLNKCWLRTAKCWPPVYFTKPQTIKQI